MFQLYDIAYQMYHTNKRDFNNDQAWLHYAGALVSAGVRNVGVNSGASDSSTCTTTAGNPTVSTSTTGSSSGIFSTRYLLIII